MENNEKQAMVSFLIFKDNLFELVFHKVLCFGLVLHFNDTLHWCPSQFQYTLVIKVLNQRIVYFELINALNLVCRTCLCAIAI